MEFRVLGPLEVGNGSRDIPLGPHKQKSLLALLLINHGSVVSADTVMDELWGDAASDRQNALWVHVSNLRSALEPNREPRSEGSILRTRSPGYLLDVDESSIDAVRFERLVEEGRAVLVNDPQTASSVLKAALGLWRGHAYEEFTYEPFAQTEIARLDELRLEAVEARIEADLTLGQAGSLVSELESLTRQHPLRERFTGQLMLALYRSGRQAEALRAYQALKSRLGGELGIEPSPELKRLEGQILEEDPGLLAAPVAPLVTVEPGLAIRGYEIRDWLTSATGGEVYRAFQPALGREVAITTLPPTVADNPGFIRRFEGDARMIAALEHPYIVPLYDFWREPGAAYLVTRLIGGGSLADVVQRSAITGEYAAMIAAQIGSALDSAHRVGVVHGDIKPGNILVDEDGNAYLSGFGVAAAPRQEVVRGSTVAPEIVAGEPPSKAGDVYALGSTLAQAMTGLTGRVEQIEGALPNEVVTVIASATDPDPEERPDLASFVAALAGAVDAADAALVAVDGQLSNPYRGLAAFGIGDADLFFGRQRVIDRIIARLGEKGQSARLVAVVGPSGSGKSSVINAGLLPALEDDALPNSSRWFVVSMTPGAHPFEALEAALLRVAVDPPPTLFEQLAGGENGLRRAVRRVLPEDGSQLLLVIDQFEELFTRADPVAADAFLDVLVGAVEDAHSRVRIVFTLRADFYDRPLQHRGCGELLREGTEVITPLSPEELEQAITRPVESLQVRFAPAVVAEIVREVGGRPGALPLLQYTLTELFEQRSGATITMDTYRQIGGVSGAIAKRAENLYDQCDEHEREAAKQMFLRMVTLGEGAVDTRRRVLTSELEGLPLHPRAIARVLDRFASHRLLTFDRDPVTRSPTVEISHEALLTEWGRLASWIEGARDDVRNQRRLASALNEWETSGRRDDLLLVGGRLARLSAWARETDLQLSVAEVEYLEASTSASERAAQEAAEREARGAAAEGKARRRLRQTAGIGVVAIAIAVLAGMAFLQRQSAVQSEQLLEANLRAQNLAAASALELQRDVGLSLRLAVEAVASTAAFGEVLPEAVDALHWAIQAARIVYPADDSTPIAVRPGPRGPTGVFALVPDRLVELAQSGPIGEFDVEECSTYLGTEECPNPGRPLPRGLSIAGGDEAYGVVAQGEGALNGTKVDLMSGFTAADVLLEGELVSFEEETGIVVSHDPSGPEPGIPRRLRDGDPLPDLVIWAQPANVAAQGPGNLIDLSVYLDMTQVEADLSPALTYLGTVSDDGEWPAWQGGLYGLPVDIDLKGLVFYPREKFEAAGYEIPTSWSELIALSNQMLADGRIPWCFHFADAVAPGWPGTDLLETMVMRVGGPDLYDAWAHHEIAFDDPAIVRAGELAETLLLTEGYVRGGSGSISRFDWYDEGLSPLVGEDPGCWMIHQADFMVSALPAETRLGVDVDWFPFPPLQTGDRIPYHGGGNYLTAMQDRPEVRVFVEKAASPEWGRSWGSGASSFISPNARFDTIAYGQDLDSEAAPLLRRMGEVAREAVATNSWRFDASDLMPGAIGSLDAEGNVGVFWQGMIDVVDGVRTMAEVLSDIERAWQALEGG